MNDKPDITQPLRHQLRTIETEIKQLGLWQTTPPANEAFNSQVPFFADVMDFETWLQWVMLPRFHALLDASAPLPQRCNTAPMAEHLWQGELQQTRAKLLNLLKGLDALFIAPTSQ